MSSPHRPSTLIVSGFSDDGAGGLFRLGPSGFEAVDRLPTTGLAVSPDGTRLARVMATNTDPQAAGQLLIQDRRGVLRQVRVDELADAHGIAWSGDGRLYAASTALNRVLILDEAGMVRDTWVAPGEGDAWHLNCLSAHGDGVVVSAFGEFTEHMGWQAAVRARERTGIVVDLATRTVLLRGLCAPHDPVRLSDGTWLVNDSGAGETLHLTGAGAVLRRAELGAWTRGLAIDERYAYVGLSTRRHTDSGETAAIAVLRRDDLAEVTRWPVDSAEVFALAWAGPQLLAGLERGLGLGDLPEGEYVPTTPRAACSPALSAGDAVNPVAIGEVPRATTASAWLSVTFDLLNAGSAILHSSGEHPVRIGARWTGPSGELLPQQGRADLPGPVLPGEHARGVIRIPVPEIDGACELTISGLQEDHVWFDGLDPQLAVRRPVMVRTR